MTITICKVHGLGPGTRQRNCWRKGSYHALEPSYQIQMPVGQGGQAGNRNEEVAGGTEGNQTAQARRKAAVFDHTAATFTATFLGDPSWCPGRDRHHLCPPQRSLPRWTSHSQQGVVRMWLRHRVCEPNHSNMSLRVRSTF